MMNKKKIIIACSILLIIILSVFVYMHYHNNKASDVKQVTSETKTVLPSDVQTAFSINGKTVSESDAKTISNNIKRTTAQSAPKHEYYTVSDNDADNQAQAYAKNDKADALIKTQNKQEIKDKQGNTTNVYDNKYYAVSSEHKNRISVGVATVDNNAYATVAYTHDRVTASIYSKDFHGVDGASVMYTVSKW